MSELMNRPPHPGKPPALGFRLQYAAVFALALACFANTLVNDYCYDDVAIVQISPRVQAPGQWGTIWTTDYWSHEADGAPSRDLLYRPATIASFRLMRQLFGPAPFPQRAANVLLHAIICVLIVRLAGSLGFHPKNSLCAGVLFAVLPIHTEVLGSIVGRADLLATAGCIGCLLCHRRAMQSGRWAWHAAGLALAFLALASKESAIGLFLLVAAFDVHWRGNKPLGNGHFLSPAHSSLPSLTPSHGRSWGRSARQTLLRSTVRTAYLLVPTVAYLVLRFIALDGRLHQQPAVSKTVNVLVDAPAWQHVLGVLQLWGMYWAKTIWPAELTIGYSINAIRLATSLLDPHVLVGIFLSLLLLLGIVQSPRRRRYPLLLFAVGLIVFYLPTSNAIVLIQVFFAERIWYLPSVFVALFAGALRPADGNSLLSAGRSPRWTAATSVIGLLLVLAMTARCWIRNAEWRDNKTLYAAAYRTSPEAVTVLHLYGNWLSAHGRPLEGIPLLHRAVEIDLGFTEAHRALGQAYLAAGDLQSALKHLVIADMQVPGHAPTVQALQRTQEELERRSASEIERLRAEALARPADVERFLVWTRRLRELGRINESLQEFAISDNRFRDSPEWNAEYAVTLVLANRVDDAIERYRASLALEEKNVAATVELAMLLLERRATGDLQEAAGLAERAAALAPESPHVLACRAEVLALSGDPLGAARLYRQAVERLPAEGDLRRIYEQRARTLGGR